MESLRLILLLVGAVFVLGLYVWIHFQQKSHKSASVRRTKQGSLGEIQSDSGQDDIDEELARMARLVAEGDEPFAAPTASAGTDSQAGTPESSKEVVTQSLIVISIMAPAGRLFSGASLLKAFDNNQLLYDEQQQFYHRYRSPADNTTSVFTVANAVNPGTLPHGKLQDFSSPGITFFLQLPGPMEGLRAFDDMMTTAERMAVELGGELQDQQHRQLSQQTVADLRNSAATGMSAHT